MTQVCNLDYIVLDWIVLLETILSTLFCNEPKLSMELFDNHSSAQINEAVEEL